MPFVAMVRYGRMCTAENFLSDVEGLRRDDAVIVHSGRGLEYGVIGSEVTETDRDDIRGLGRIIRKATDEDVEKQNSIHETVEPGEYEFCLDCIKSRKMPMKLAGVEHIFGGEKIIYYFLAEGRVDFRALVKDLARQYRTRIEMRQIGVRDEARLLADYEHCGRELCCRTFMNNLEPVSMRMAKVQKTTLDPSKISGHCGRLMCCLRFEDEVYVELKKRLPHKGTIVRTEEHEGEVFQYDILNQTCRIETREGDRVTIRVDDIVERKGKGKGKSRGRRRDD